MEGIMNTTTGAKPHVGMVGVGSLGSSVASALGNKGVPLTAGYDKAFGENRDRTWHGLSFPQVESPRAVADVCDVAFIAVYDDEQVMNVLGSASGIVHSTRRPLTVILLSTVSLECISLADDLLSDHDISLVDCGCNGSPGIRDGTMVASVGGPIEAVEGVRPLIELFANPTVYMGRVGNGMKAKLIRNMIIYATWYAAFQGAAVAEAAGLDVGEMMRVVDASERFNLGSTHVAKRAFARSDEDDASAGSTRAENGGIVAFAHKDLSAVLELGQQSGMDISFIRHLEQGYNAVMT